MPTTSEQESKTTRRLAACIVAALALLSVGYLVLSARAPAASEPLATAFVKVADDKGHGSGVHIGDGYIITAAHVVNAAETMTIVDSKGHEQTGTLLWQNAESDVALMRVDNSDALSVAPLDCAPNPVGQRIRAIGNPRDLDDLMVTGVVAGPSRTIGHWASGLPVDMTVVGGMSGGAVINDTGAVVGIVVGSMNLGRSPMDSDIVGLGIVVPATAICTLLART